MKKPLLRSAALAAGALLIGVGVGLFATRTPTTENAEAKTQSQTNHAIHLVMKFPLGIKQ